MFLGKSPPWTGCGEGIGREQDGAGVVVVQGRHATRVTVLCVVVDADTHVRQCVTQTWYKNKVIIFFSYTQHIILYT